MNIIRARFRIFFLVCLFSAVQTQNMNCNFWDWLWSFFQGSNEQQYTSQLVGKPVLLFDFDGTIADAYKVLLTIFNDLAREYGYSLIEDDSWRKLSAREVLARAGVPWWRLPFLRNEAIKRQSAQLSTIHPFAGIPELLATLTARGYRWGVITSNARENVEKFLTSHGITGYEFIYSDHSIFGKHKVINRCLEDHYIFMRTVGQVLYVGDEVRDIEAARKSRIKIVAVTWGFNDAQLLEEHKPDFLINKPSELLDILSTSF